MLSVKKLLTAVVLMLSNCNLYNKVCAVTQKIEQPGK